MFASKKEVVKPQTTAEALEVFSVTRENLSHIIRTQQELVAKFEAQMGDLIAKRDASIKEITSATEARERLDGFFHKEVENV